MKEYIKSLSNDKNIDKHLKELLLNILIYKTELDTTYNWLNNEWIKLVNEKTDEFKEKYKGITNKWIIWNGWVHKYIVEPKKYQCCVYVRSFLEKLYVYLNKEHLDHKKHKEMWESSQYLQYYIHLIFKTKKYNDKVYETNEEILEELKKLISFSSESLHGFSIFFNKKYISSNEENNLDEVKKNMQKKVNTIVNLISENNIYDNGIYQRKMEEFLNFFKNNCLEEFNKEIEKQQKFKEDIK